MCTGNGRPDPRPSPPAAATGHRGSASHSETTGWTVSADLLRRCCRSRSCGGWSPMSCGGSCPGGRRSDGHPRPGWGPAAGRPAHRAESGVADGAMSRGRGGPGAGRCPPCRAGDDRARAAARRSSCASACPSRSWPRPGTSRRAKPCAGHGSSARPRSGYAPALRAPARTGFPPGHPPMPGF